MLPLLREFFKTKLQLGYILCFLAVASLFLSAQKSLAPRITADYSFKGVAQFSTEGAYISQCSRLTALKLSQKIASLGHVYAEYGKGALSFSFHPLFATCAILALFLTSPDLAAFAKQAVGGNTFIFVLVETDLIGSHEPIWHPIRSWLSFTGAECDFAGDSLSLIQKLHARSLSFAISFQEVKRRVQHIAVHGVELHFQFTA